MENAFILEPVFVTGKTAAKQTKEAQKNMIHVPANAAGFSGQYVTYWLRENKDVLVSPAIGRVDTGVKGKGLTYTTPQGRKFCKVVLGNGRTVAIAILQDKTGNLQFDGLKAEFAVKCGLALPPIKNEIKASIYN